MCADTAPAARKPVGRAPTDDEDDEFERVEDLNHLEVPDDEDGHSSGGDSELDDEDKMMLLKLDISDAKCELELLQFDYAIVKAALGVVSFALLLACLYIFTVSGHVDSCPAPPPAVECPMIPACPPAPPVHECPKCPQCPAAATTPECPKVSACEDKPWDYENPSLKLESYMTNRQKFSRDAGFNVKRYSLTVTGGFVSGFDGPEYIGGPRIGEEIIAVGGVDVREKSVKEIDELIALGTAKLRAEEGEWGKTLDLRVRRNPVYSKRIRDAVAEAGNNAFKCGVFATVMIILIGRVYIRTFKQGCNNKSNDSSCNSAQEESSTAANNANEAEKTFVQQLNDCAGEESVNEDDQENDEVHDEEEMPNAEEKSVEENSTVDMDNKVEETATEVTDLTAVINAQKVQVEDNRVELEMFADRLAELKRDCERMEKTRADLASQSDEPEAKKSWLDRMLDECGIPQNGG